MPCAAALYVMRHGIVCHGNGIRCRGRQIKRRGMELFAPSPVRMSLCRSVWRRAGGVLSLLDYSDSSALAGALDAQSIVSVSEAAERQAVAALEHF